MSKTSRKRINKAMNSCENCVHKLGVEKRRNIGIDNVYHVTLLINIQIQVTKGTHTLLRFVCPSEETIWSATTQNQIFNQIHHNTI